MSEIFLSLVQQPHKIYFQVLNGRKYQLKPNGHNGKPLGIKKKNPTHRVPPKCCPKTTTAIHTYNIPQSIKICKKF